MTRPVVPGNTSTNDLGPTPSNTLTRASVESHTVTLGDADFCIHEWNANAKNTPVVVVIFHGFLAHGLYPTVRYAAEFLANKEGYIVVAPDLRGHGQSSGLAGYLPSADVVLQDGVAIVQHVAQKYPKQKLFLLGSSMGGTISLQVAMMNKNSASSSSSLPPIAGVILLAPMLKLDVDGVSRNVLYGLAHIAPTLCIIPSSSTSAEKQYRDATKREECETDPHTIKGDKIRIGSASTCVELAGRMKDDHYDYCKNVDLPFFLGVADDDMVVDNQGSLDLFRQSVSQNKTMKMYPALHGLLCEPSPLFDTIQDDILQWIQKQC